MIKLLLIFLILTMLVVTSCTQEITYNDTYSISLGYRHVEESKPNQILSNEQAEYLYSIWNNEEWIDDIYKVSCDYEFEANGVVIWYASDVGAFVDVTNQRSIGFLTNEQRDYINTSIIGTFES